MRRPQIAAAIATAIKNKAQFDRFYTIPVKWAVSGKVYLNENN